MAGATQGKRHFTPEMLGHAIEAASVALWAWDVETDQLTMDELAFELWGMPWAESVTFEELSSHIHPSDRDRVRAAFVATRAVAGAYEIDFRIMVVDEVRWISARGKGADEGILDDLMFGIFLDVTGRKQAQEGSELLAGEMGHRLKNLLSVANGLTQISSRASSTVDEMTHELTDRLAALDRAHDLVRPLPGGQGRAALLGDLIAVLLAPYDEGAAFSGRIRIAVPRMGIGDSATTALAMVFHELATNSVKHGALSSHSGSLNVSSHTEGDDLYVVWAETGGPSLDTKPEMTGFGNRLISRSIENQFGGNLEYDWQPTGLVATLRLRKDRMAA